MTIQTPDIKREIDDLTKEFEEYWYLDGQSKEIRLKPFSNLRWIRNLLWKKRFKVYTLYHWAKRKWALEEYNKFHFPLQHDNMPIDGFPIKYELQGGWTIPKKEITFLTHGPLATEDLHRILVPALIGWERFVFWFKQLNPVLVGLVTLVGTIIKYKTEIISFFQIIWVWVIGFGLF